VKSSSTDTADGAGPVGAEGTALSQGLADTGRSRARASLARRSATWAIPLVVVVAILILWQILVQVLGLKPYFIPSPLKIASTFKVNFRSIADNSVPTIAQAATGFAIGNALAVIMSVWFVHVSAARRALYPLAIILQSIPLVALAPIFLVTLGDGFTTKVVMTAIISFFPTLVNMMRGLASVDTNMLQLFQSVDASRWKVLTKLRWPTSLPYLFAGLRITASASMVGAIIVEWISSDTGLGYMIINSTYQFNTPLLWASIVASSLLVLVAFGLVVVVERLVVPWSRSSEVRT
jgi:NitT/TauT family transport system permease protein